MAEYSIPLLNDTHDLIEAEIKTFGDQIKVKSRSDKRIIFEANKVTAQALSVKTGIEVYPVNYATIDMGMKNSFFRNLQVIAAKEKLANLAIQHAKAASVPPVDGQPAERFAAKTDAHNFSAAPLTDVKDAIEKAGARLHTSHIPTLSVVFFDVADPKKLDAIKLPQGWTLEKLSPPAP